MNTKRLVYLDVLRILAIIFVVFNHTGANGYTLWQVVDSDFLRGGYILISVVCKTGVYLFFMISGVVLLQREDSIRKYFERIVRIVLALFLGSFVIYLYTNITGAADYGLLEWLKLVLAGELTVTYWFLYSYLGFLIMLPFLRILVRNMKREHFLMFFAIYVLFADCFPILFQILGWKSLNITVPLVVQVSIGFPLAGYFLHNNLWKISAKKEFYLGIVALASIIVPICMTYHKYCLEGPVFKDPFCYCIMLWTAGVFLIVKYFIEHINLSEKMQKMLCGVGNCTFGVYLFEYVIKQLLNKILVPMGITSVAGMPEVIGYVLTIVTTGVLVTFLLKKLPLLKIIL